MEGWKEEKSWPFLLSSSFGLAPPRETLHLLRPNFKGGKEGLKASVREAINPPKTSPPPPYTWVKGGKGRLWCVFPFDRSRKLCFRSPGWSRAGPKKENFMVYDESRDEESARPTLGQQPGCNSRNSLTREGRQLDALVRIWRYNRRGQIWIEAALGRNGSQ